MLNVLCVDAVGRRLLLRVEYGFGAIAIIALALAYSGMSSEIVSGIVSGASGLDSGEDKGTSIINEISNTKDEGENIGKPGQLALTLWLMLGKYYDSKVPYALLSQH